MGKIIRLTESDLERIIRKLVSEQVDPNAWKNSPKAAQTKKWAELLNKKYKLNLPLDGNWMTPQFNKAMETYIKEKGLNVWVCKKGDGWCNDGEEGQITVGKNDMDKLYDFFEADSKNITQNIDQPKNIKMFQDWLDKYFPNWIKGGKLNKGRGYGTFGPYTKAAWSKYKSQYKEV